jgi:hypothetical protein
MEKDLKRLNKSEKSTFDEFVYILGLSIYDIFSKNHEVVGQDNKIYDFGTFRGCGRFIADFLNNYLSDNSKKYDYMDFYMGTSWNNEIDNMIPFYEFVFQKLKDSSCNWRYSFSRLFLLDTKNIIDNSDKTKIEDYKPEQELQKQLKLSESEEQTKKLQADLDIIYKNEYEEAKFKPLILIVQAYKNIFGVLPTGHPQ